MFLKRRAENIKYLMRRKYYNQKKIAEKLNVSESYVTRLINGERYNKNFEIFIAMERGFNYGNLT